jgi:hypothetical protein
VDGKAGFNSLSVKGGQIAGEWRHGNKEWDADLRKRYYIIRYRILPLYNKVVTMYLSAPQLFDSKVKISKFLVKRSIKAIECQEVIDIPRTVREGISISFNKYMYKLLLFPAAQNRKEFIKRWLIRYQDIRDIKSTNPFLLFLYRPFSSLYRSFRGIR